MWREQDELQCFVSGSFGEQTVMTRGMRLQSRKCAIKQQEIVREACTLTCTIVHGRRASGGRLARVCERLRVARAACV